MMLRRLTYFNLGLVLLGAAVAGFWVWLSGGDEFLRTLAGANPFYLVPLLSCTAICVFLRFLRWQFLLRCVGVRLPIRASLRSFLASLPGTATPAYLGELIRGAFVRREFGVPLRVTAGVLVVERLLDIVALATIAIVVSGAGPLKAWLALAVGVTALVLLLGLAFGCGTRILLPNLARLSIRSALLPALCLSVAAWTVAGCLVGLAAASLRQEVGLLSGIGIFSRATLGGGLTLMPAGIGSTGSLTILELEGEGLSLPAGVAIASLVRLSSTGIALSVGAVFFALQLRWLPKRQEQDSAAHFDQIAAEYRDQFSPHIWGHLLERKTRLMAAALPPPHAAGLGLDLGCGLGEQCLAMGRRGFRMIGLDVAPNLLRQAGAAGATVVAGDAVSLPFADASFDFVYSVGALHHLDGTPAQQAACREVWRVLKPGGLLLVHESNPRNPLFRFYMSYLFPLLKSIDEGTEWWIDPRWWEGVKGMRLVDVQYFTFLPDFIPSWMMQPFLAIERRLEASAWRSYSVHYLAVLRKLPEPRGSGRVRKLTVSEDLYTANRA